MTMLGEPQLARWPNSVALYSGGVDSYCMTYLYDPDVILNVNLGGRYGHTETRNLRVPPGMKDRLRLVQTPEIGQYEQPDTKIIPARNAILAFLGAQYGDNLLMGSVAASRGNDKDQEFADRFNHLCDWIFAPQPHWLPEGRTIRLILPVKHITKTRLVGAVLATGHDPDLLVRNTFSCYEPDGDKPCGNCPPCGRRWAAFTVWGLDVGYDGRNSLRPYIDEIEAGHTSSRTPQFIEDVLDAWHGTIRKDYS